MARNRCWPQVRTSLLAHAFGAAVIGVGQFALTSVRHPGACASLAPPLERLCYWLQSGLAQPLTDLLDKSEITLCVSFAVALVSLALLLGWSLWSLRPNPQMFQLRLGTLMAIIAIAALEWVGGRALWDHWLVLQSPPTHQTYYWSPPEWLVVRPGDILIVEVLEALPGRPITGERQVASDGRIDLGYYGRVYVDGLTIPEAKARVILHLQHHLDDQQLGLIEFSESEPATIARRVSPSDSEYVFVDCACLAKSR
jgi:hypothetical protein